MVFFGVEEGVVGWVMKEKYNKNREKKGYMRGENVQVMHTRQRLFAFLRKFQPENRVVKYCIVAI